MRLASGEAGHPKIAQQPKHSRFRLLRTLDIVNDRSSKTWANIAWSHEHAAYLLTAITSDREGETLYCSTISLEQVCFEDGSTSQCSILLDWFKNLLNDKA